MGISKVAIALIFILSGQQVFAASARPEKPKKQIICEIWDEDDQTGADRQLATLTIILDQLGLASNISIVRNLESAKTSSFLPSALNLIFNNDHDFIIHGVRPGRVIDHENGKPVYDWEASRIEFVEASNDAGDSLSISINDHKYSGHPGSTVNYKLQDKIFSGDDSGVTTSCEGSVKLPMVW